MGTNTATLPLADCCTQKPLTQAAKRRALCRLDAGAENRAASGSRTRDPFLTMEVLYL